MLQYFVLLGSVLSLSTAYYNPHLRAQYGANTFPNVTQLIAGNGYPVQDYQVETSDGYILDLIQIPYGIRQQHGSQNYGSGEHSWTSQQHKHHHGHHSQKGQESGHHGNRGQYGTQRPAVLLMHGLLASSEDFVLGGPNQGLAYILADYGYNVFMGNVRGSTYGRKHSVLNPERDPAFWKFCWDEMGTKDLPAIINKVLEITQQGQIYYVGHMQGSTIFYVLTSEMPEYNNKFKAMIALQPMVFIGHSSNVMLQTISENQNSPGWVVKNLGANEFTPSVEIIKEGGEQNCYAMGNNQNMCQNPFFLINGYNSQNLNATTATLLYNRNPSGASTRQMLHYGQLIKTGKFTKYCAANNECQEYDLQKVTTPNIFLYTQEDMISTPADIENLSRQLPNIRKVFKLTDYTNNLDLLYGNNVADVYQTLVRALRGWENNESVETY